MSSEYSTELSVLLIEDQPAEVDYIREILSQVQSCRFTITHRDLLNDGLELLEDTHFDVLLLDLCLPDSTGYVTFTAGT